MNIRITTGDALLHVTQSKEVEKLLIDNGADLSTRDKDYEFNQCVGISEILITKGADVNRGDNRLKGLRGVDGQDKIR